MSAESTPLDPYQSPADAQEQFAKTVVKPEGRPLALSLVCVLCLVIGVMGAINGLMAGGALIAGKQLQAMLRPDGDESTLSDVQSLQQQIQDRQYQIQQQYFWPILVATFVKLAVCIALAIAGMRALSLHESDRRLLFAVCGFVILYELLWSVIQFSVQYHSLLIIRELTNDDGPRSQQLEYMVSLMNSTVYGVLIGLIFLQLVKIAFFASNMLYLRRADVRALFRQA
ncbi:hypothetical protein NA78x_001963 [Anatilimnocola sp. NA78]|uniref:hypothetical protein n=1 Tax=Anatilimnocola sp. NA78 TaxID=3415683 RepID=UPI003CE45AFF